MRKLFLPLSMIIVLSLVLSACAPTGTATQAPVPTEAPAAVPETEPTAEAAPIEVEETPEAAATEVVTGTAPAATGTLVVWDQFYRGVESEVIDTLNQEFEASHEGVTINRDSRVLDDLMTTVKLAMAEPDGPDVSQVNQGRADMGAMVQGGLLLPLDEYADQYGWAEKFSESVLVRNRFEADGSAFGTGNLYGVSPTAEVVGVYYNKGKFEENGWEIPQTWADFEQLLADIAAAGETPITFGNLDGWPGIHMYSAAQHVFADFEYINDLVFGLNDQSWVTPENQRAAETMQAWVEQGYFTDGFEGIGYDDSVALYKAGEGVLMITGSWLAGELIGGDQQFGFFLVPQESADETPLAIGGVGVPYTVRATTAQPDLAAEYLDWMVSPRAAQLWAEASFVPAMPLPEDVTLEEGSLFADTVQAWNALLEANGVGHYIDWASPTMYDTLVAQLQALFAGQATPEQVLEAVQADYEAFLAGQ